ncbi:MAG: phosphogluconate dehydratase [Parvularcula sp.]
MSIDPILTAVTDRIRQRSDKTRKAYLDLMKRAASDGPQRSALSCGNLAHAAAACPAEEKRRLAGLKTANLGIVTAYNDMLSAHEPLKDYPDLIKRVAEDLGGTAQVAGGVPAMCDGVTQGREGMELSLFSRDIISMATAVALSHNVFDGALMLGVCDKIVPGLFIGAARFGHLPIAFVPAGPMPSGLPNDEKSRIRREYADGKVDKAALLEAETESYHAPGTCTFYGTANSNQVMMEVMGLHLPGSSFVPPGTLLRKRLVEATARKVCEATSLSDQYRPFYSVVDERSIVNAIVALHATGGSTNHLIHLVAMAKSVGVKINWDDFSELSSVVPLLCRIYPNGLADVNQFHDAGGTSFVFRELLDAGLLHKDAGTITGSTLDTFSAVPKLDGEVLGWQEAPQKSGNPAVLYTYEKPAAKTGGLKVLNGNIGRAVIKVSSVADERRIIRAPAMVFTSQEQLVAAFKAGQMERDVVAVILYQGPKANGMPELHSLTPSLTVLQNRGHRVALLTDGRMSGASGVVPAAIHMTPEAAAGGVVAKIQDGDIIELDAISGTLTVDVDQATLDRRPAACMEERSHDVGMGRELFHGMRQLVSGAEDGAMTVLSSLEGWEDA